MHGEQCSYFYKNVPSDFHNIYMFRKRIFHDHSYAFWSHFCYFTPDFLKNVCPGKWIVSDPLVLVSTSPTMSYCAINTINSVLHAFVDSEGIQEQCFEIPIWLVSYEGCINANLILWCIIGLVFCVFSLVWVFLW